MGCIISCTGKKVPTNEATVAPKPRTNYTNRPSGTLPVPTTEPTNGEPPLSFGRVAYPVAQSFPIRNIDQEIAYSRPPPTPPLTIGSPPNQFSCSIRSAPSSYSPSIQGSFVSIPQEPIPGQISLMPQPQAPFQDSVPRPSFPSADGQSRIGQALPPSPLYFTDFTPSRPLMTSHSADCLKPFTISQNVSRPFLPGATRDRTHSNPVAHQDRQAIFTTEAGRSVRSSQFVSIYHSPGNMYVIFLESRFTFLIQKSSSIKPKPL